VRLYRRFRQGANAIEFALVLPIFIAIVFGMLEFSWVFFQRTTVVHAVRNGCRAGATVHPEGDDRGSPADIAQASIESLLGNLGIDCNGGAVCSFDIQQVGETPYEQLDCTFSMVWEPLLGLELVPTPDQLRARSIMQFELQL
jgi:hypothetical protein